MRSIALPLMVLSSTVVLACRPVATHAPPAPTLASEPVPIVPLVGDTVCLAGVAHAATLQSPERLAAEIVHYHALGVKMIRYDVDWSLVEKTKGQYDLDWLEPPLEQLEAAGIRSIPMLGYGNTLYNRRTDGDTKYPAPPAPFAAFAGAVAKRFGTRFGPYEIWNEPNAGYRFYKPKEDPVAFAEIVKEADAAIKQACPACQTLFGGVFWHPEVIMGGVDFIRAAYAAQPTLRTTLDGLAVHPYAYYPPLEPPDWIEPPEVPLVDMMSQAAAATGRTTPPPEWITEGGWPIQAGTLDEAAQAADLVKAFALADESGARSMCWYDLQDGPNAGSFPPEDDFGLLHYDPAGTAHATPKAAYTAMQAVSRLLGLVAFSRDRAKELGLTHEGDAALFFRDAAGTQGVTVLWSTSAPEGSLIQVPLHTGTTAQSFDDLGEALGPETSSGSQIQVPIDIAPRLIVEHVRK